jgi:hypothetical protein
MKNYTFCNKFLYKTHKKCQISQKAGVSKPVATIKFDTDPVRRRVLDLHEGKLSAVSRKVLL